MGDYSAILNQNYKWQKKEEDQKKGIIERWKMEDECNPY